MTLDDDIAEALRERARALDQPFKQVVNEVLRRGLRPNANRDQTRDYRVSPNHSGLANGVDPSRLNQVSDQLQAEAFNTASAG